jgi:hypothetical protein
LGNKGEGTNKGKGTRVRNKGEGIRGTARVEE